VILADVFKRDIPANHKTLLTGCITWNYRQTSLSPARLWFWTRKLFCFILIAMRKTLFIILALVITGQPAHGEVVSVPVDVSVQVKDKNYYLARQEAVHRAFATAVYRAAAQVASSGAGATEQAIQDQLVSRAEDYVASYKFLEESIDYSQDKFSASMEVAVYMDAIWSRLKNAGAVEGRRKGKKLVALIHEERLSFLSKHDFLLLTSPSEEAVAGAFRQNGYIVADRDQVRAAGLGKFALKALDGDHESLVMIGSALEADLLLFGRVTVRNTPTAQGEKSSATIKATLYRATDGSTIATREEFGELESADSSRGALAATQMAAQLVTREFLAVAGGLP